MPLPIRVDRNVGGPSGMAKSRRKAREAALRALYQLDLMKARQEPSEVIAAACEGMQLDEDLQPYATELVNGVAEKRYEIDRELRSRLAAYSLDRVAEVDRAVLRIAAYEILFVPSLAPAITVNEAVEIAKKYSTAESGRFVNGVLGRLVRESDKANWTPANVEEAIETAEPESEPEVEEIMVEPEEAEKLRGRWKLKSETDLLTPSDAD